MVKKVVKKKIAKRVVRKPKPKPDTTRADIHAILNECDGEEALRRIREVLYGPVPETPGEQQP
jgi:hypothetical protein